MKSDIAYSSILLNNSIMDLKAASLIRRTIYESLGEIASAFASPARLKIIQILAQANRSVDELAEETNENVANVSQHLQRLSRVGLVSCERQGVSRIYQINNPLVLKLWETFQNLGHELNPTLDERERSLTDFTLHADVTSAQVIRAARAGKATLIDVRMEKEARATPVKESIAIPLSKLKSVKSPRELGIKKNKPVYALCRGRYCSLATEAVQLLRTWGYDAYRLRESAFQLNLIAGGKS